jgi:LysR family transcriptional regulator, regulator for metE and metH
MLERIHLSIVQQVEQQGSLTAAAGVLNLTQSALSHSMKKLEQQLGTDVWLREGRSLRLTQAGQYLLAVANRVLPQLDLAEERLGQFAQGVPSVLPVAAEDRLAVPGRVAGRGCGRQAEIPVRRHRRAVRL